MTEVNFLEAVIKRTKAFEGWNPKPYKDTEGNLTIGYGTNIERISRKEAELLLLSRLTNILKYDIPNLPEYETLSDNRKMVYLDMLYNMGYLKFKEFKKMRQAVLNGKWFEVAVEIINSKYAQQVGKRAEENAALMREG
jgi:lysozyme